MSDVIITLIHPGETEADDEKTEIFASENPVGRNEFQAAGVNGYKAEIMFEAWKSDYDNQPLCLYNGDRLTIYRTYPKGNGRIELYAAERIGNNG